MTTEFNSFSLHVRDSLGHTYLHQSCANRPEILKSAKEHARWWIGYRKRPGAWHDKDVLGKPISNPVGRCEIVVEFYHDESAVPKRRARRAA